MGLDRSTGAIRHHRFHELPSLLNRGDLLIVNDTRVLPARLYAAVAGGASEAASRDREVEILLLREEPSQRSEHVWSALAKPAKALRPGTTLRFTSFDRDRTIGGNTWLAPPAAPAIVRSTLRQSIGIEVATMDLTISTAGSHLINGVSWIQAARRGALDGMKVLVERAAMPASSPDDVSNGKYWKFSGDCGQAELDRLSIMLTVTSRAHDTNCCPQLPKTKLELFETRTGAVMIKGTAQIGVVPVEVGSVVVRCKEFTDTSTGLKESGIAVVVRENEQHEETTIVDHDEIDSLIKGIDYLGKVDRSVTPLPGFEAVYTTRGELQIATHSSRRTGTIEAAVQSSRESKLKIFLTLEQLARFRLLIEEAKNKLDSIR